MVGACIIPCGAPAAQSAEGSGTVSRPRRRGAGPVATRSAGLPGSGPRGVVLWDPDSHRRMRLSVLDSTEAPRDR